MALRHVANASPKQDVPRKARDIALMAYAFIRFFVPFVLRPTSSLGSL